ncbi:NAD(P)/FAD-dependent oxidoreductase, partial [Patescibacteria group bacterium]|nr:NAD(P)/FAD-dependent oxidoreductase [Patescibacteria group bacterium]
LDREYNGNTRLNLDGLFIEVGSVPSTSLIKEIGIEVDESNCIKINQDGSTNVKGVYSAGDITNGSNGLRQIVTAVSEGAVAVTSIYKYLKEK